MEVPPSPVRTVAFRLTALAIAMIPLALLGVTRILTPDTDGLGTHQQLGLPPCSMRVLMGIRCPGCGMTTSWAHFTRGEWISSMQSNMGGFLLACLSVVVSPVMLRAAMRSTPPTVKAQNAMITALLAITAVTFAEWTMRIF